MTIRHTKTIKKHVCALLFFISPFSFSIPAIDIDSTDLLRSAHIQHEYYFNEHGVGGYLYSFSDSESYQVAKQFQKLLDAKVITVAPEYKVDKAFLSAFKQLNITTSEQLDSLLIAFTSPIYQKSPNHQLLVSLYHSVVYGSAAQATMRRNTNWNQINSVLWFLGNFPAYYVLKPHLQKFLDSTYANSASPALYNQYSHFFSTLLSFNNEDYLEDLFEEVGQSILWALSCKENGEELRNTVGFMESCKVSRHAGYNDLKGLQHNSTYQLKSEATSGSSKVRLTPVPGYSKDFRSPDQPPETYSKKSLHHIMSKVVEDKTEGVLFYVLYRGADKFQFFAVGVYEGNLSLSYVVMHHAPTPVLTHLIPLQGMNLDQIIDGIDALMHQGRNKHDMVPDLQGVWMLSSE